MDPITLIGIIGSVASVISLFRSNNRSITVNAVASQVIIDSTETVTDGGAQRQRTILDRVTETELRETVAALIAIDEKDKRFLERINQKCLAPLNEAIGSDMSDTDLEEQKDIARYCVCRNIRMAKKGGKFPNDAFKKLWDEFDCGVL